MDNEVETHVELNVYGKLLKSPMNETEINNKNYLVFSGVKTVLEQCDKIIFNKMKLIESRYFKLCNGEDNKRIFYYSLTTNDSAYNILTSIEKFLVKCSNDEIEYVVDMSSKL